jgi:hypothetical protein
MAVVASEWLAIGLALVPLWVGVMAVLCLAALWRGAEFEGEIKAASFRLRLRTRPRRSDAA